MTLYLLFLLVFGVTALLGSTSLSLIQFTQIHQKAPVEWFPTAPATLVFIFVLFIIVAVIVRIWIKPLDNILKKIGKESITEEEKYSFIPKLRKAEMVARVAIYVGFVLGNCTVVGTKVAKGLLTLGDTPSSRFICFLVIFSTCLVQAMICVVYNTQVYEVLAQKIIRKLGITDIKHIKPVPFTRNLCLIIFLSLFYVAVFVATVGYGPTRFDTPFSVHDFMKNFIPILLWCLITVFPISVIMLADLRKRFTKTNDIIEQIQENDNLAQRIYMDSFDNLGQITSNLNRLMAKLNKIISEVSVVNNTVHSNADELLSDAQFSLSGISEVSSSFEEINRNNAIRDNLLENTQKNIIRLSEEAAKINNLVNIQANAIEGNASSVTQMVANINSVSEMIKKEKVLSQELLNISQEGTIEVKNSMELIKSITEKSERMSEVTKVISAVASQTNLLAMNAAIEAAHAGEAGAGFSVVADEIRKLAESTSSSTKEIKNLIGDMISVIDTSCQSMNGTSRIFSQINSSVQQQNQIVGTISDAMDEQSAGASETLKVTNEIASQITEINSYVKNQTEHNIQIEKDITNVVELSETVNVSLEKSKSVIDNFEQAVNKICDTAKDNKAAVENVSEELGKFKL